MKIDVITIFPEMIQGPLEVSILKRARQQGLLEVNLVNLRDYSGDKHFKVDDYPFGGGSGMVMKPDSFSRALAAIKKGRELRSILFSPRGKTFNQRMAEELAKEKELVLICGHYEGIDERVSRMVTEEVSLGDFVLTGGEIPALALIDAIARLLPGVIGAASSLAEESFTNGLLEYPQYTRPPVCDGMTVPEVLVSGNHGAVADWRRVQALRRTFFRRPDLLRQVELSKEDRAAISSWFEFAE